MKTFIISFSEQYKQQNMCVTQISLYLGLAIDEVPQVYCCFDHCRMMLAVAAALLCYALPSYDATRSTHPYLSLIYTI